MEMEQEPALAQGGGGPVQAVLVPQAQRLAFLPDHFGRLYMAAEQGVYRTMRQLCADYDGGYWDFYALSNGGALLVPTCATAFTLTCEGNGYSGRLPAFATGIGVCAMAYSRLSFRRDGVLFAEQNYRLRDLLLQQAEAAQLLALLD